MGEELCSLYSRLYNLNSISLRIGLVLDWEDLSEIPSGWWPNLLWGGVDVRDVAQAIEASLKTEAMAKDERFFITAADQFSPEHVPTLVEKHFPKVSISKDFLSKERSSFFAISKAMRMLGYQPKYDYYTYVESQKRNDL